MTYFVKTPTAQLGGLAAEPIALGPSCLDQNGKQNRLVCTVCNQPTLERVQRSIDHATYTCHNEACETNVA